MRRINFYIMKKFLWGLLGIFVSFCLLSSCENETHSQSSQSALDGTLWECQYKLWNGEISNIYIEFNGNNVSTWTNDNFYWSDSGTYSIKGNTVYFSGLEWKNVAGSDKIKSAQFTSNTLSVIYLVDGNTKDSKLVFYKK